MTARPHPIPASGRDLLVSETFVSVQGEGLSVGIPAAFLRLGNCNLACSFCDTPYSWDATRYDLHHELSVVPVPEMAAWVTRHAPGRLIVTGGEPLLQQKQLVELLNHVDALAPSTLDAGLADPAGSSLVSLEAALKGPGAAGQPSCRGSVFVEVETNGTVVPVSELVARVDQWNVSPKLQNSGEPARRRLKERAIEAFSGLPHANFKFVVRSEEDAREVDRIAQRFGIAAHRILLMPEAQTKEQLRARSPEVAAWALARRARFSGRLHLELFGGKRGT